MTSDPRVKDLRPDEAHGPQPDLPFWKRKTPAQMDAAEWESLCDGCGRCCLNKLHEEETDRIFYTSVGCRLLDTQRCSCRDYPRRQEKVEDCEQLTPANIGALVWLPPSCGYRLIAEGKDLYWWHHLVSGDRETVHIAGVSVRGRVSGLEDEIDNDLEDHLVEWPVKLPKRAQSKMRPRATRQAGDAEKPGRKPVR